MTFPSSPNGFDKNLIFDFFWKFSVFERALKSEGFLRHDRKSAELDWDRFSQEISGPSQSLNISGFQEAARLLKDLSPKKQMNKGGKLSWEPVVQSNESDAEYAIRLLKVVRNNLFHGGKYSDGSVNEIARDTSILRAALKVLDGCYEFHPRIRRRIDESAA